MQRDLCNTYCQSYTMCVVIGANSKVNVFGNNVIIIIGSALITLLLHCNTKYIFYLCLLLK